MSSVVSSLRSHATSLCATLAVGESRETLASRTFFLRRRQLVDEYGRVIAELCDNLEWQTPSGQLLTATTLASARSVTFEHAYGERRRDVHGPLELVGGTFWEDMTPLCLFVSGRWYCPNESEPLCADISIH